MTPKTEVIFKSLKNREKSRALFRGSGTLIGQKSRFREGFGRGKAIFSEFQLRSEIGATSKLEGEMVDLGLQVWGKDYMRK